MKLKNLLFLMLTFGLLVPGVHAQNAGFAVGLRPGVNPPVPPMYKPPVQSIVPAPFQGRVPHFSVTPHIVPPIISTYPGPFFPSPVPLNPVPQGPRHNGQHRPPAHGGPSPSYGGPNSTYGGGYAPSGPYGGPYSNSGNPYYGGTYATTTIVVPNGTVITNSTVIVEQPAAQVIRVGPGTPPNVSPAQPVNGQGSLVGMSREQVIQQLGAPISGIYTMAGETLSFSRGITVIFQNGKVVVAN